MTNSPDNDTIPADTLVLLTPGRDDPDTFVLYREGSDSPPLVFCTNEARNLGIELMSWVSSSDGHTRVVIPTEAPS